MKFGLLLGFFAVALSAAPIAQVSLVSSGNPSVSDGTYDVGPYVLSVNGVETAALCIDLADDAAVGDHWSANLSTVGGDTSKTYHPGSDTTYLEAGYLFRLITAPNAARIDIQHAAWALFDGSYEASLSQSDPAWKYINQAAQNYSSGDYSNLQIVSSVSGAGMQMQEFIIDSPASLDSPEPGTFALLGVALLLGGFSRSLLRRRQAVPVRR